MPDRILLLIAALGVFPVALTYGVAPSATMNFLFGFTVDSVNHAHVFRAVMGLYLASGLFWLAGALRPGLRIPALWSLFVFMAGLAAGRLLSVLVDGLPSALMLLYILVEIAMAALAVSSLRKSEAL